MQDLLGPTFLASSPCAFCHSSHFIHLRIRQVDRTFPLNSVLCIYYSRIHIPALTIFTHLCFDFVLICVCITASHLSPIELWTRWWRVSSYRSPVSRRWTQVHAQFVENSRKNNFGVQTPTTLVTPLAYLAWTVHCAVFWSVLEVVYWIKNSIEILWVRCTALNLFPFRTPLMLYDLCNWAINVQILLKAVFLRGIRRQFPQRVLVVDKRIVILSMDVSIALSLKKTKCGFCPSKNV